MKEKTKELRILYVCGAQDSLALFDEIPLDIKRRAVWKSWCRIGEIEEDEWEESDIVLLSKSIHPAWVMKFSRDLDEAPYVISLYTKKMGAEQRTVLNGHVEFQRKLNFKKFSTQLK